MTLAPELMNAILSMDAYNRGYNPTINLTGNAVGEAQIIQTTIDGIQTKLDSAIIRNPTTGERLDDDASFYAIAYDTNNDGNADIIAYRGTDNLVQDATHGWTLGGGFLSSDQGYSPNKE